jgi:ABC-type transporter Mla MlaB component
MLRITRQPGADHDTLLLEGNLSKELIEELQQALAHARQTAPITLDLSGLRFVDDEGAHFLRDCRSRGASLLGASPFVSALLDLPPRRPWGPRS